jgi:uncharacterized protein (TIRG00374 family)
MKYTGPGQCASRMKKNFTLSLIAGFFLSAIALYLALKNVPISELIQYFATINYFWVVPSVFIVLICFFLRAVRWQIILESSKKMSVCRAFHPMMIGFMINCVLPGRFGEVARPAILKKKEKIPFTTGLATVAAERVFDICTLVLFFIVTFSAIQINPDLDIKFGNHHLNRATLENVFSGMTKLGIVLIAGIVLISISKIRNLIHAIIMAFPNLFFFADQQFKAKLTNKLCEPLIGFVENIAQGFNLIKYPKKMLLCFIFSLIIWGLHALSYYIFSLGSPGIDLTLTELAAVMVIIMFFIALPSVPGFWGLWEAGGVFALALFGVSSKDAAGFTLANHAIQMFPIIIVGIVSTMIVSVNIWKLSYEKENYLQQNSSVES